MARSSPRYCFCSPCFPCTLFKEFIFFCQWVIWLWTSTLLLSTSSLLVLYTVNRILFCIVLFAVIRLLKRVEQIVISTWSYLVCGRWWNGPDHVQSLLRSMRYTKTLKEWQDLAFRLDQAQNNEEWKRTLASDHYDYEMLERQITELRALRKQMDVKGLIFSLQNIFHRKYCGLNDPRLFSRSFIGTKHLIEEFYCEVVEQLSFIAANDFPGELSTADKILFFRRAIKSLGKTACCLSGGGALAMYHIGVVRALLEGNCLPRLINGSSGGSIIAGMLATRTDEELRSPGFLSHDISNRFGVRWLPSLQSQIQTFVKQRVLMQASDFTNTTKAYYGDMTFEEGFVRTDRCVSITVSFSAKGTAGGKTHAVVLNHVTSPQVLIRSAVCASCALPGLMEPQPLLAKNPKGEIVQYYPKGTSFIDGSLQADLPFNRLSELFDVNNFIASQTNPGLSYIGNSEVAEQPGCLTKLEKWVSEDTKHRLKRLAKLRVIPKIYGQDIGGLVSGQAFAGHINIYPVTSFYFQFKVLAHPTNEDMAHYIRGGEHATWPHLCRISHSQIIENTLEECLGLLERRANSTSAYASAAALTAQPASFANGDLTDHSTSNGSTSSTSTSSSSSGGGGLQRRDVTPPIAGLGSGSPLLREGILAGDFALMRHYSLPPAFPASFPPHSHTAEGWDSVHDNTRRTHAHVHVHPPAKAWRRLANVAVKGGHDQEPGYTSSASPAIHTTWRRRSY